MGPIFFEFIQRKRDEGFGEGNFTALFKSIEADQIRVCEKICSSSRGSLFSVEPSSKMPRFWSSSAGSP